MFLAIIGPPFSGKSTVEEYLIKEKGFTPVRLIEPDYGGAGLPSTNPSTIVKKNELDVFGDNNHQPNPLPSPAAVTALNSPGMRYPLCFSSPNDLLLFVTSNWKEDFVSCDLNRKSLVDLFIRRPFFMLLSVDAPLMERFTRCRNIYPEAENNLEQFVRDNDRLVFQNTSSLHEMRDMINIHIVNGFHSVDELYSHVDGLDLLNSEHLRPSWDAYFMTLASLASRRSNCMKRRVGAVLVRDNRVLATGYNGTPRGLINCNAGGCHHCNGTPFSMSTPVECVCLHAEENALLEAGRERIGHNAVLYCNTCPCLKCTIKIIQTGVKIVVYNLAYKMDIASASLFQQSGVELRRYDPHTSFRLPPVDDESQINGL